MDFAKKQLEKFGWKEGTGLGKNEQGIVIAIKPTLKVGKEGMGFDLSKELVDTWWTRAYDDSLKRINIDNDSCTNETVGVTLQGDDDEGNASGNLVKESGSESERPFQKMRKRMMKASFPIFSKGATLTNGELLVEEKTSDSGDDSEDDKSKSNETVKSLTDEELFKACGGRTLHKAARFGLKLNGKLARIAAQEEATKAFLSKYATLKTPPTEKVPFSSSEHEDNLSKKELKKKKKSKKDKTEREEEDQTVPSTSTSSSQSSDSDIPVNVEVAEDVVADTDGKKKKKKDKKRKYEALEQYAALKSTATNDQLSKEDMISQENEDDEPSIKKHKKKSKKHKKSKYNKDNVDDEECCALLSS